MITLDKNERLVCAGTVALRAPDGTALPAVQQYIIVSDDETDHATTHAIKENQRLVCGGRVFTDRQRAEERFAALKAGREQPPREVGTPLYLIEDAADIDPKTGRTHESEKIIQTMSKEFAEIFSLHMRKEKALEKQGEKAKDVRAMLDEADTKIRR